MSTNSDTAKAPAAPTCECCGSPIRTRVLDRHGRTAYDGVRVNGADRHTWCHDAAVNVAAARTAPTYLGSTATPLHDRAEWQAERDIERSFEGDDIAARDEREYFVGSAVA
jgi:transposase